ncbi:alpha-1,2-mannosyltransferase [Schizosaccharomyces cryophilus OY26]|uniref:Alpha-1,2-mannosyltransferase n=1 Tax=Schizosaccharomyces cryophilus (strain OY26 / ATCC MYA-4695 / CBS 11777 / NBRC 106824 / NRRL Y48691) TaxID=653667 RepID=S9VYR3_SCHCR|nr:alpha-1,2-mannosyltransferase [Schizosaccharomyces cryophilus OY26]EPY51349.1 alpha-1,2-mannosyltransferase [Schizosaccharomyces cryophilus OY26]
MASLTFSYRYMLLWFFIVWTPIAYKYFYKSPLTLTVDYEPLHLVKHDLPTVDSTLNDIEPALMNATLFMLCRNKDLIAALSSIQNVEDRFNKRYHYPWTFMNDAPFSKEFINATTEMASSNTTYVQLEQHEWGLPKNLNMNRALQTIRDMTKQRIIYGFSLSYRIMCRFNSGFFYRNSALKDYDYYWRVEPGVIYSCDVPYDPFRLLRDKKKAYGFVVTLPEYPETIRTLWNTTRDFVKKNPHYLAPDNSLDFIVDDEKGLDGEYNGCHFWSNFEIADLNFFRSDAYTDYFEYLDQHFGFFYERWGDAPIHSIAASLFLNKSQIHYFEDFGYYHLPWSHCPSDYLLHANGRCICDPANTVELEYEFCYPRWYYNMRAPDHKLESKV